MDCIRSLLFEHSALQAVIVLSLISTLGIVLGKIRIFGVSLGTAFIFFVGILAGHLGLSLDPAMLVYAESFGLILFVYALGLQVGPGFFSSLRSDGIRLLTPALLVLTIGTLAAIGLSFACNIPIATCRAYSAAPQPIPPRWVLLNRCSCSWVATPTDLH